MDSIVLICEPRCEGSYISSLVVILNLDRKQIDNLVSLQRKVQRAVVGAGIDKNAIQHLDLDEDLAFWLTALPEQIDENWEEDGDTIDGDEDDDFLWRVLEGKTLDEDKMNVEMERLDVSSMRLSPSGICFSAYLKHNPSRYETAVISWDELKDLLKRFPKPVKRKKRKVK